MTIIGGGPAGLTAAIYACLDKVDFILIEPSDPCWFMKESVNSHKFVERFLGINKNTSGTDLQKKFLDHYKGIGGKILKERVLILKKQGNIFIIKTNKRLIHSKTVIIASGAKPRELDIEGREKFKNFIHYYCTIDGKKYINKSVIVVGGRNSGAIAACYLYDLGCKVALIEIKDKLQAKTKYQHWLRKRDIKIFTSAQIVKLDGNKDLQKAIVKMNDKRIVIPANSIFSYVGRLPNYDFFKGNLKCDAEGYIVVDNHNETSVKELFAAGDVTSKLKQIITACGDGANACYFAEKYLTEAINQL